MTDKITIERETLLPCPFCGANTEILTIPEDHPDAGAMFVQCCDSRCMTSSALLYPLMDDVRALLVERWNRRAALAAPVMRNPIMAAEPLAWRHDCAGLCTNDVELWIDACPHCGKPRNSLRAALAAQPAEPAYTHADVAEAHAKGYALGLRQVDRPHPTDAQPTGQSPCARHCEAPAFEGEIRRLKREATIKDSLTIRPPAPAAVPLTDEQIDDICWNFNCSNTPLVEYDRLIARAIEAAHGIAAAGDKP